MEMFTALLPYAALAGAIGISAFLVNRAFYADESALDRLFQFELDPPWPHGVQEEEPVRWNVERLHRPTRADASPPAVSLPIGVRGAQSAG